MLHLFTHDGKTYRVGTQGPGTAWLTNVANEAETYTATMDDFGRIHRTPADAPAEIWFKLLAVMHGGPQAQALR